MRPRYALLVALLLTFAAQAILADTGSPVRLKSRTFTPVEDLSALDAAVAAGVAERHFLVQPIEAIDLPDREALSRDGVRLTRYIPDHTWLATFSRDAMQSPAVRGRFAWVGELRVEDKMPARLVSGALGEWAWLPDGRAELRVRLHDDADLVAAGERLRGMNVEIRETWQIFPGFTVHAPAWRLSDIAALDEVMWITEGLPPIELANDQNRQITGADIAQGPPYDLSGLNVHAGIWDNGRVDPNHDDFANRLTLGESASTGDHATHVAGTVGASGILSQSQGGTPLQWRGMAPEVLLYSWYFDDDVPAEIANGVATYDLDVETNSWTWGVGGGSCDMYGDYDFWAPEFDALVRGAGGRKLNIQFAAANERDDGDCPLQGGYECIPPPSTAKNITTVGATNSDDDSMTGFSSWGPVDDGRLKPDVTAPGCQRFGEGFVKSTLPGDRYGDPGWCGTSMATPTVTGNLALLYELHRAIHGPGDPETSLMKAALIGTAQDLGRPGPDYSFGHGRIDVHKAADVLLVDSPKVVELSDGEVEEWVFRVRPGLGELRVVLAWDDPDAAPLSDPALVNDLDLVVLGPGGTEYEPWVLDPADPDANAVRGVDHLNNVEHVTVADPAEGLWTVRVTGTNVPEGPQVASVVGLDQQAPAVPMGFEVVGSTGSTIDLVWTNAPAVDREGTLIVRWQGVSFWLGPQQGQVFEEGQQVGPGVTAVYVRDEDHSVEPFTDTGLGADETYHYAAYSFDDMRNYSLGATATGTTGDVVAVEGQGGVPAAVALGPARPNPAWARAEIPFAVPARGEVRLRVYDTAGRLVRTLVSGELGVGEYRVVWDGRDEGRRAVAPGVYFVELRAGGERLSRTLSWMP
jgi:hypothetical protein